MASLLGLLLLLVPLAAGVPRAAAEEVDRIAAVVGDTPILESDVRAEAELLAADPSSSSLPPGEIRRLALRRLIDDQVLLAKAKAEGIAPSAEEIEDALDGSLERMRSQFPGEKEFQAALEAENITLEELRKRYRREVEKSLTARLLLDREIRPKTEVTDAEVRRFFEEHKDALPVLPERVALAQIYLKPAAGAIEESAAVRELEAIRERAAGGEDFGELARAHSEDPSASAGGDLGYFGRGDMDAAFEQAAFALASPGDISGVVETRFGYHLVQLVDRGEDRIRVRHILKTVPAGEEGLESARRLGEAILDSLRAGTGFAALARKHSDDRPSAARGGEIGIFAVQDMTDEVRAVLDGLEAGEASPLVEATDGFHIFLVLARFPEGKPSFEEAEGDVRAAARQAKQQQVYQDYLDVLRKEVHVEVIEEGD
ncbi:MAG: peptidylprolyl isomerase [Candidatus Eisenbacteria bacterium]